MHQRNVGADMDKDAINKAFSELYSHLESLETQTTALIQILTAKGIITDKEFAPFVEEAGNASYVKWLATRLRVEHVLSTSEAPEKPAAIESKPPAQEPEVPPEQENEGARRSENAAVQNGSGEEEDHQPEQTSEKTEADAQREKDAA